MRVLISFFTLLAFTTFGQQVDMSIFEKMKARSVGPAGMSGRITCIEVIHNQPNVIYVGAASGGVWKSTSGGTKWEPITDTLATLNIGSLAIQQSNPSVIWVGTGEGNPRNSQSSGFGLYKTMDGGKSWELMGFEQTRNIHRILIHPDDPNTVWIGSQGPAWGDNTNRGVYKTTDGGKTWKHVLKGNASTGIADMVLDPTNPNKLIACMWDFRREPWTFRSGGEGSGMFISHDGGETWEERTEADGLPKGELGRMGLAIAPSEPNRIYALIEAEKNGVYRSDDGGFNWYQISADEKAGNRPFYYSDLFVDPTNENRIYSLHSLVSSSEDGGKSWKTILPYWGGVHPDHHALYIHPTDPDYIILGNDGGLAISRDRAKSWKFVKNLPLAQYYHINIDNELPYNIYGGMQDNGSWRGPAYTWGSGIKNNDYLFLMGGDGFDVSPDPDEPSRYGYAMSQQGNLGRYDMLSGNVKDVQPTTDRDVKLRYSWNAPIAQDPFDNNTIYYGSQFVMKSTNSGDGWVIISPDLTTNDTIKQKQLESGGLTPDVTGAENHTTLLCIEPSRIDKNVIWAGSDDGRIHVTMDGGKNWTSVEGKIKGMPFGAWVPQIHSSKHNAQEAFVVVNNYRMNDWKPYLFHTTDGGKTWKRLADESDFPGYCLSIIQDPTVPELLFLGTENGLFVSFDKGANWNHWKHGFPNVSAIDLKIQEREADLVIGTFGRSAFILDDITPLREYARTQAAQWKKERLEVFDIPTAYMVSRTQPRGVNFDPDGFRGENRTTAARIQVYFTKEWKAELTEKERTMKGKMRVMNAAGDTIRTQEIKLGEGVNRLYWYKDRKRDQSASRKPRKKEDEESGGLPVLPGMYTIEIECDSITDRNTVNVMHDPRRTVTAASLKNQQEKIEKAEALVASLTELTEELHDCQAVLKKVKTLMPEEKNDDLKALSKQTKKMGDTINGFMDQIFGKENTKGLYRNSDLVSRYVNRAFYEAWSSDEGNDQRFEHIYAEGEQEYTKIEKVIRNFITNEWKGYTEAVEKAALSPLKD
jgi:photosystem II stability/assembly factor-like uncharacterized protein/outer membrane protein assembly factor BamE (lipoprotein component of BamABCDE complex)